MLEALGIDPGLGDMDCALGREICPPPTEALRWMVNASSPRIVTVSNFIKLIRFFNLANKRGQYPECFEQILWVYLRKSRKHLARHLEYPMACGELRSNEDKINVVREYGRFSKHFNALADHIIDSEKLSVLEMARRVHQIAEGALREKPDSLSVETLPGSAEGRIQSCIDEKYSALDLQT